MTNSKIKHSKEKSEKLANHLTQVLNIIDIKIEKIDFDYAESALEKMEVDVSTARAVGGILVPLEKADDLSERVELFSKVFEILKLRKKQKESTIKRLERSGQMQNISKIFGL